MSEYIQWFVEDLLREKYDDSSSLGVWIAERNERKKSFNIKWDYTLEKQMTIYDVI
ncbi:hypothetical protein [Staphylococcus caprae]|uniref:hypothetical protein n=1 Tax=Staphylococcus caprae TaxID=29380 RepID=UPI000E04A390|nr:hypothetical protein [Staphylococcus caprae]SUL89882.1 Uncharacterised protein [Staphylococcus caprae]